MKEIKLEEGKQRKVKGLSKAIYIIAKILNVITIIGMVGIVIGMLTIGIVGSTVKVDNNQIKVVGQTIDYERNSDEVTFKTTYKNKEYKETVTKDMDVLVLNRSLRFLEGRNTYVLILAAECALIFALGGLAVAFLTFKEVIKLFKNIHDNDTPFTLDNIDHIRNIGKYLIIGAVIKLFGFGFAGLYINSTFNMNFDLAGIILIIAVFLLAYIFEYGYRIQLDSKGRIYGDMNE